MSPARKQLYAAGIVLDKAKLWDLRASQENTLPTLQASLRKPTKKDILGGLLIGFDMIPPTSVADDPASTSICRALLGCMGRL